MNLNLDDYTFGVEVEFTGCTRETAAVAVAETLNGSYRYVGGGYREYNVTDSQGRTWHIMSDSSISAERKCNGRIITANEAYKCELVTPILRYSADIDSLQSVIRALRKAKAFANTSAGIHVHVGAEKHTPATMRNMVNIFKSKQDMLYKALAVNFNHTHYCKKLDDEFVDRMNSHNPTSMDGVADEVYKNYGGYEQNHIHYSRARYFGINFHSYFTKGTIEMRLFNSTLYAGWVRTYVILAIAMNNQAIHQRSASPRVTTSTNECFTFRTWLLRMGFIGEIFKVSRQLLLKNLAGNIAWRYREANGRVIQGNES